MNILKYNNLDIPENSPTEILNLPYSISNFSNQYFLIDDYHPVEVSQYSGGSQLQVKSPNHLGLSKFWMEDLKQ